MNRMIFEYDSIMQQLRLKLDKQQLESNKKVI